MGDTGVFATTAEVQLWVPEWASATYNAEAYINEFIGNWEAIINNNEEQINFSDTYSTLNRDFKLSLHQFVCANVAMHICSLDPSGTDLRTAEFFFDHMTAVAVKAEQVIKKNAAKMSIKNS